MGRRRPGLYSNALLLLYLDDALLYTTVSGLKLYLLEKLLPNLESVVSSMFMQKLLNWMVFNFFPGY